MAIVGAVLLLAASPILVASEKVPAGFTERFAQVAMRRVEQAGAVPMTALQVLLEYQRDWAHKETYNDVMAIVKEHCGAYGQGVEYAYTMVHGAPPSRSGAGK